jgi:hypothetical protein
MHVLSKSSYMRGRQCPKALFLVKHRRELLPAVDPARQMIFDTGTDVGRLAWQRYPGGVDLSAQDHRDHGPAIAATAAALRTANVLYEAAFQHAEVLSVMDILVRTATGWEAIEVKSSASVKEPYLEDAALQYHVITSCGVPLERISILYIDTRYVRQGELDVQQLFGLQDITREVLSRQEAVKGTIAALKTMLEDGREPEQTIGPHCNSPYPCDFKAYCWKDIPAPSVLDLAGRGGAELGFDLFSRGIVRLEDIPPDEALNERQLHQVAVHRSGLPSVDAGRISQFLQTLQYPVHCLDFETFAPAIPLFPGCRPYQQLPFQYSLHRIDAPGSEPVHVGFLAEAGPDPRRAFLEQLLAHIGPQGTILAYNRSFEAGVLQDLGRLFPEHAAAVEGLLQRMVDLALPFQKQWYLHPVMQGRYSIKVVLPAVAPGFSHGDLVVQDGRAAGALFTRLMNATTTTTGTDVLRQHLWDYCTMDTLAMVKLLEALQKAS